MKPAFSVLFLTTLIGAGQGLLIAMVGCQLLGGGSAAFYAGGGVIALVLLGLGLFASFFHLANPQRAWRTATRWRTSWLSREVIVLPALAGLALIYTACHAFGIDPALFHLGGRAVPLSLLVGLAAVLVAVALFVCTGMIYACVRFIPQWAQGLTVVNYLLMGLASGFTLAAAYGSLKGSGLAGGLGWAALAFTLLALAARLWQLGRNKALRPISGLRTAIGARHPQVRQVTQGFMCQSFNTIEFQAPGGADTVKGLTLFFLLAAFGVPAALLGLGLAGQGAALIVTAFVSQYVGLLAERWVFFAAGNHVQNLYYQAKA
jgi:DMSO reductase anchor subunit